MDLSPYRSMLRQLTRTDPDPRVRHRADALLLVAGGLSLSQAGRQIGCARNSIHTWAERFLAEGREGLIDRRRLGPGADRRHHRARAGDGGHHSGDLRGAGGELKLLQWQAPATLLIHQASGDKDTLAASLVSEPLMHYGMDAGLLPNLVTDVPTIESGTLAEDLTSVTLHLTDGVVWSDGEPFTSADVKFTWEWVTKPENSATTIEAWQLIESIETPDDHTLNVTFSESNPLWYAPFSGHGQGAVLPKHVLDGADQSALDAFRSKPVGTGPFVVTDFQVGDQITYEANPNYRDANKPFFSSVLLKGGGDPAAAARAVLETGDYHFAWFLNVDAALLQELEAAGKGRLLLFSQGYAERLNLNHSDPNKEVDGQRSQKDTPHPFFSDPAVRKAMSIAINKQLIVDQLYIPDSIEAPAKDIFAGIASLESPNTQLVYDPEQAKQLLEDAGWTMDGDVRAKDGVKLQFVYATTVKQLRQKVQAVVKANLEAVGFKVDLQQIDSSIYFDSAAGNDQNTGHFYYDANMHQTAPGTPTPITFVQAWYSGPDGENVSQRENGWSTANQCRYRNDDYDALFEEVRTETDAHKQIDLFMQMNDHLIDNAVLIPLVNVAERSAAALWLNEQNLQLGPFGFQYWNIANWNGTEG